MLIKIPDCEPLRLSADTIRPELGKFDSSTSYASKLVTRLKQKAYREKKLPFKLECLRTLKVRAEALGGYKTYYEPLAGVGLSVRLFAAPGKLWLNDQDEGCQRVLRENFKNAVVWGGDMSGQAFPEADLIFMDFNNFTFKRYLTTNYREFLERGLKHARKFLVLNDCSIFYFRYGGRSFQTYSSLIEEPIFSIEEYFQVLGRYYGKRYGDWSLVQVAYFQESSFQLFYRGKARMEISKVVSAPPVVISEGFLS